MQQYHTLEEITDKYIGKRGTPERESFDAEVEAMLTALAIKDAQKPQSAANSAPDSNTCP